MIYLNLFYQFFMTGLFAVGGGLATLPFLSRMAEETGWFTQIDLANMVAISESTPGPLGVNMATYTGYTSGGLLGGIVAVAGLITPSIIVIILVARVLKKFQDSTAVQGMFYGFRPASTALIAAAGIQVFEVAFFSNAGFSALIQNWAAAIHWKGILWALLLYFLIKKFEKHPAFYIALSAVVGILFRFGGV